MRIAVTTPTGNIGSVVARELLDAGADVTLLVRDASRVAPLVERGADAREGDLRNAEYVREATKGVDALFWVTPPNPVAPDFLAYQEELGEAAARAVRLNGIARTVHLSSVGAGREDGTGAIIGLHRNELRLDEATDSVTHLRCNSFMENFLMALDGIAQAGSVFLPVRGEAKQRFVATRDIGRIAAKRLLDGSWSGVSRPEVVGPEDLSYDEAAAAISEAVGRTVNHVNTPEDQTRQVLSGMGFSDSAVEAMLGVFRASDRGLLVPEEPPVPETTGRITLAEFARTVLAPALQAHTTA